MANAFSPLARRGLRSTGITRLATFKSNSTIITRSASTWLSQRHAVESYAAIPSSHVRASRFIPATPFSSTFVSPLRRALSSDAAAQSQKACIQCSAALPLASLSCSKCDALQPLPSELDAYQLLGLDQSQVSSNGWDVDAGELKTLWRKSLALSHPDRMGGRSEKEQQIAAQQSAMLNKAYETLREPLQRAHLILEQLNSSAPSEAESLEDPEVLMEVMELREELEDASSEDDAAALREKNKVRLDATLKELQEAFASSPPDIEAARSAAVALRYWSNIDKAAREWQPGKRVELQH